MIVLTALEVQDALGEARLAAMAQARDFTAQDLADWMRTSGAEVAQSSARGLANRLNDRFVAHLASALSVDDGATWHDNGPSRELVVDGRFVIRCKRHGSGDSIASVATPGARNFWSGQNVLPSMEVVHLAAGYRWDKEKQEVGPAILSYRTALRSRPLWVAVIDSGQGSAAAMSLRPLGDPGLPSIDLFGFKQSTENAGEQN